MSDDLFKAVVQSRVVLSDRLLTTTKQPATAWNIDQYVSWVAPLLRANHLPDLDFYVGVLQFKTRIDDSALAILIHPDHRLPTREEALATILLTPSCIDEYFREQPSGRIIMHVLPAPLFHDHECVNFVRKKGSTLYLTEDYVHPQWAAADGHLVVEVPKDY